MELKFPFKRISINILLLTELLILRLTRMAYGGNPETTIRYGLVENLHVILRIYNLIGQPVRTLVDKEMPAGQHTVHWNGKDEFGMT